MIVVVFYAEGLGFQNPAICGSDDEFGVMSLCVNTEDSDWNNRDRGMAEAHHEARLLPVYRDCKYRGI